MPPCRLSPLEAARLLALTPMSELHHECGICAIYHMDSTEESPLAAGVGAAAVSRMLPRMLQDIQNRGQLAAGMTSFNPVRHQLLDTYKEIGSVSEAFKLAHREQHEQLMRRLSGRAAIGHVRYATCGPEDQSYAQPYERHHLQKHKWFSFAFNGQIANYAELRDKILADDDHHLSREGDSEIVMHEISRELSGDRRPTAVEMIRNISKKFDGAYSIVFLNSLGEMVLARDPMGIKPLCYAKEGPLFAAASESVALLNLGFARESIHSLAPGHCIMVSRENFEIKQYAESPRRAHCFFEWIYFANVASTLDERSVYLSRTALGVELAKMERQSGKVPLGDNTIVVPVPDTSKAAADSMAYQLGIPSREGLIRNRYAGRTFIEGGNKRIKKAETKYTPLREVLEGKRVFLVEDSIVRSTTMRVLLSRIRELGGAKEIHVRVACPPIIAPCFYGIDMSTVKELFAPRFLNGGPLTLEIQDEMARELGADSLRFLPVESISRAVDYRPSELCQACITGQYPTPCGQRLYSLAQLDAQSNESPNARTYETRAAVHAAQTQG